MASQSTSIPDAQPDPFHKVFKPDSIPDSLLESLPDETPDSQESQKSTIEILRDERIAIQTALKFKIPHSKIREVLDVTEGQIKYARNHCITPQKFKTGQKSLLCMPQRN